MSKLINKVENNKDKLIGKVKEAAGRVTDNEGLEIKGKLQSMKSDIGNKTEEVKNDILGKANDFIDQINKNRRDKE